MSRKKPQRTTNVVNKNMKMVMENKRETVDVRNITDPPRMLIYRIPHQEVCVKTGRCFCNKKTGSAASLHIPSGLTAEGIDAAFMMASEVRDGLKNKEITVVEAKNKKGRTGSGK